MICKVHNLCLLSCFATSDYAVTYSWTKDGKNLDSDDVEVVNNSIFVRPRRAQDYGVYVCNASNSFSSTAYKITLTRLPTTTDRNHGDDSEYYQYSVGNFTELSRKSYLTLISLGGRGHKVPALSFLILE